MLRKRAANQVEISISNLQTFHDIGKNIHNTWEGDSVNISRLVIKPFASMPRTTYKIWQFFQNWFLVLYVYVCKVNIWDVRRQLHSFSTQERMFFESVDVYWRHKRYRPEGTRTHNLRVDSECCHRWSFRGHFLSHGFKTLTLAVYVFVFWKLTLEMTNEHY